MPYAQIKTTESISNQVSTPKTWDRATARVSIGDYIRAPFTPIMQVVDKDTDANGQVWLLVKPTSGSITEQWIIEPAEQEESDFEQGLQHGKQDADQRLHPIYAEASCEYSKGYLQGYRGIDNPQSTKAPTAPPSWSVTYNDKWQWYTVWVGNRAIGRASTSQEAERIGQKYVAASKFWQEHRERVLASYAD